MIGASIGSHTIDMVKDGGLVITSTGTVLSITLVCTHTLVLAFEDTAANSTVLVPSGSRWVLKLEVSRIISH